MFRSGECSLVPTRTKTGSSPERSGDKSSMLLGFQQQGQHGHKTGHSHPDIIDHCREEVEEFFDSMDRDFDGRLTFEEFMGEESTIEKLFKNMDKNGDGVVTKQVRPT